MGADTKPRVATDPEMVRAFLDGRDAACPLCRYNLRDLTATQCPECGSTIELRVALEKPRMALWIMGLIGLSMGAGSGTVFTTLGLFAALWHGTTEWKPLLAFGGELVVCGLGVWAWLALAPRIRRARVGQRALLVLAIWACVLVYPIVLFLIIN